MSREITKVDKMMMILITVYAVVLIFIIEKPSQVEFTTVKEIEEKYTEPVYLIFHWYTIDELSAGNLAWVQVDAYNLPYAPQDSIKDIQIRFDGTTNAKNNVQLENDSPNVQVLLKLTNANERKFSSEQTRITYVTGGKWGIWLCDYNSAVVCSKVSDIVEVSPHSTSIQLNAARNNANFGKAVVMFTMISVWLALRKETRETLKDESDEKKNLAQTNENNDEKNMISILKEMEYKISEQENQIKNLEALQQIESLKSDLSDLKVQMLKEKSEKTKSTKKKGRKSTKKLN